MNRYTKQGATPEAAKNSCALSEAGDSRPDTRNFSAYLARLGEQAAKPGRGKANGWQRFDRCERCGHPIGDRRTGASQQSWSNAQPVDENGLQNTHSLSATLTRLVRPLDQAAGQSREQTNEGETADKTPDYPLQVNRGTHCEHCGYPIGDRREIAAECRIPDALPTSLDYSDDSPSLSDLLARLNEPDPSTAEEIYRASTGQHGKQPAGDKAAASPLRVNPVIQRDLDSHPIGDRRDNAVERGIPAGQPVSGDSWQHALPTALARLKAPDLNAAEEMHEANKEQQQRDLDSHPIGDRRIDSIPVHAANTMRVKHSLSSRLARLGGQVKEDEPLQARITLGIWGYYFIAKLSLFWMGLMGFHPLENLAFAAFILWPVASRTRYRVKNIITVLLALTLLYHDSWLPPAGRVISQASSLSGFSFVYLVELAARFVSLPVIGALLAIWLAYWIISKRVNLGALLAVCMVVVWIVQSPLADFVMRPFKDHGQAANRAANQAKLNMDAVVNSFFAKESQRSVSFVTPSAESVPFDVIFIHVCSLSWDDLRATGLEQHPLWRRFDILLTRFNSAASYSGPAVIHLLRATCGQQEHSKMYFAAPDKCYLMGSLQKSGFEPGLALNHDGKFDDFLGQVQRHGRLNAPPLNLDGLDIAQHAFDNAPIYDDLSVLNRWLKNRQKSNRPRTALFYNSASLHDGNHLPGTDAVPNTLKTYKVRLTRFLDDIEKFMQSLDESGRRAVVVMVPEHGGALRGDKRQIAGLREIPTPAITLVPVGIKVIGGKIRRSGDALSVDQPVSYLAIAHIVARMLEKSPFANDSFAPADYVANLPTTSFVAQNEKMTVAEYEHRYYLNEGSGGWEDYSEFNTPPAGP